MSLFSYNLSENGWEHRGIITVESNIKPECVNDNEDNHYLIVNGAKIFFDEEIVDCNY